MTHTGRSALSCLRGRGIVASTRMICGLLIGGTAVACDKLAAPRPDAGMNGVSGQVGEPDSGPTREVVSGGGIPIRPGGWQSIPGPQVMQAATGSRPGSAAHRMDASDVTRTQSVAAVNSPSPSILWDNTLTGARAQWLM